MYFTKKKKKKHENVFIYIWIAGKPSQSAERKFKTCLASPKT